MNRQAKAGFDELFDGGAGATRRFDVADPVSLFGDDLFGSSTVGCGSGVREGGDTDVIPLLDASIKAVTLYPRIALGGEGPAAAVSGVFLPKAFEPTAKLDAIVYLHGHHKGKGYPPELNIADYWTQYPHFRFRQVLNATASKVVLIAPTLGPASQAGWLVNAGGLDRYMEIIRGELVASGYGISSGATWGNIVLACHSGGGSAMRKITKAENTLASHITQCWGFDSLYSDDDVPWWLAWGNEPGKGVFLYYGNGGTATRAKAIAKQAQQQWLNGVSVAGSETLDHNKVPMTYWRERILALP